MSKHNLPEVRIINAWLLREAASVHIHRLLAKEGEVMVNHDEIDEIIKKYKKAWDPLEKKILNGMCDTMDLEFYQNTLDVYVAPWFYAFSEPLIMGVEMRSEEFVSNLTHEIIHRLLTDNTSIRKDADLRVVWAKMFGKNHSPNTLVHIPVHAVHKAIALDVLDDPSIVERDYKMNLDHEGKDGEYVKSWDYVNSHDYKEIIEKLKTAYETKK
jgi:hypothetical protein